MPRQCEHSRDVVVRQSLSICTLKESAEVLAVEAIQAFGGAKPQETIIVLGDARDPIARSK